MRRVLGYQDILIGGTKYQELKGKRISLEKLSEYPWISLTSESITRYAFCVTKCQQKKILAVWLGACPLKPPYSFLSSAAIPFGKITPCNVFLDSSLLYPVKSRSQNTASFTSIPANTRKKSIWLPPFAPFSYLLDHRNQCVLL